MLSVNKTRPHAEVAEAEQKKIDKRIKDKAKKITKKAKNIIADRVNKDLFFSHLSRIYKNLPHDECKNENVFQFVDSLYFLNLNIVNIITQGNVEAYDPYLRDEVMKLLLVEYQTNKIKKIKIDSKRKILSYLLKIEEAFKEMMNNISALTKAPIELAPLILAHSTKVSDASDHMVQTCNDRFDLISSFITYGLVEDKINLNVRNMPIAVLTPLAKKPLVKSQADINKQMVAYLQDFYGAKSFMRVLPKVTATTEEKIIKDLINQYEQVLIFEKKIAQPKYKMFSFLGENKQQHSTAAPFVILSAIRKTIMAYKEIYNQLPLYLTEILSRINGLIPMPKVRPMLTYR